MSERDFSESGLGIGGAGRHNVESETAELVARGKLVARPSNRKQMRCRSCGQTGYAGEYPFSTAPSTGLCDDCL
jgi:hypothetical protein